ncbi:hypothetical protein [Mesorhizobium shangrilense]|uniref:Uncharacterized protein n=1 Tax=Mesorhizobium shangrilense TaxID=460060 RepID=A0ABV2DE99_9HYPH
MEPDFRAIADCVLEVGWSRSGIMQARHRLIAAARGARPSAYPPDV